jgi:glycosyltransferase-like protein
VRISLLTYSTRPRGGVVHTLYLAESLASLGHEVHVHSLGRGGDSSFFRSVDPAVHVHLYSLPDLDGEPVGDRITRSISVLAASIDISGHDIVHAQDCISANAVVDCIRTVHHIDHFTTPQLITCHDRAIRRPYAHICVSRAVADELYDDWGVSATVIPNGVDAERFEAAAADDQESTQARTVWHDRIGGPFVLIVGGIEPRKGTVDLVDAMAEVRSVRPDVRLVIAGGETLFDYRDYRADFDRRCDELGVSPIVLGMVDDDALPSLVASCDVFAFPSVHEGFGLAPMEALAAGRPLVCRDLPVLREVFDGAAMFASDVHGFAAAIVTALEVDDHSNRGHIGIELARRHRWLDVAKRHVDFYASVAS